MSPYVLVARRPQNPLGWWIYLPVFLLAALLMAWMIAGAGASLAQLIDGLPWIGDFLARMLPPNFSYIGANLIGPTLQTIQIALLGTLLAVVLAIPLSFLAAHNLSPSPVVYHFSRQVLNVGRGINEIILALIFVAAVGLGPFAGVLALTVHGAGMLGKFFAEAIEEVDRGPIEAMESAGCSTSRIILFAILPQVLPAWLGVALYRLEANIRVSTILGMVGAGGIGFELMTTMKLFEYENTAACVLVILALVFAADLISARLRKLVR
ncbi:phosphonate transport system permease protein [Microbulbifer donghaiensis]|uniref:Phosphonate transport system permease protein n=1 Tax=Microbulbifer donghaiensis TaxID=494016 RepID=A0A1M5G3T7_9GAMM|nr:phosphonate ABC transporter, permease protein PhnE [Microbulbifer donghaiensis]SHF98376.1 phosphonate transport system permease protein [Microbulbifer donghaiensis]